MRAPIHIFYFENREGEAEKLADLLWGLRGGDRPSSMQEIFSMFHICWELDPDHAVRSVKKRAFDLYILDLETASRAVTECVCILEAIHQKHMLIEPPVIWIWGTSRHLERYLVREYGIVEFFEKNRSEERLRNCLRIMLQMTMENGKGVMRFPRRIPVYSDKACGDFIQVNHLICILSRNREFEVRFYRPGEEQYASKKYTRRLYGFSQDFEDIIKGKRPGFHQISRGVIVNEIYIQHIYTDKKPYSVTMYRHTKDFKIRDAYLPSLEWMLK